MQATKPARYAATCHKSAPLDRPCVQFKSPALRGFLLIYSKNYFIAGIKPSMFNLIAAFFLLLISTFSSVAQPIEGNKFSQILPLGSGRSIPLPEGQWLVTFSNSIPVPGAAYRWQVTTLKNLDPESPFAALTVRHSDIGVRWSNTACDNQKDLNISFLVSKHGTSTNQLINKCSRFIAIPDGLAPWSNRRKNENNKGCLL